MDYRKHVRTDAALLRPAEVETLRADPTRARQELGWEPRTSFEELVRIMVDADVDLIRTQKLARPG
jgi:GDPmannose 4,6-dehydratase